MNHVPLQGFDQPFAQLPFHDFNDNEHSFGTMSYSSQLQAGEEDAIGTGSDQVPGTLPLSDDIQEQHLLYQAQQYFQPQEQNQLTEQALNSFNGNFVPCADTAAEGSNAYSYQPAHHGSSFQHQQEEEEEDDDDDQIQPSVEPPDMAAISSAGPHSSLSQTQIALPIESPGLLTQQWTVPPRPKPGRKPADDSPISKRKAQNRQAQRNFRERKAKKVDELEAEMSRMREEFNFERNSLQTHHAQDRATKEEELQSLRTRLRELKTQLAKKTEEADRFKKEIVEAQRQAAAHQRMIEAMERQRINSSSTTVTSNIKWGSMISTDTQRSSVSQISPVSMHQKGYPLPEPNVNRADSSVCSRCGSGLGVCQCVEMRLKRLPQPNHPHPYQPISPTEPNQAQIPVKSSGFPTQQPTPGDEMEIDFTTSFSRPQLTNTHIRESTAAANEEATTATSEAGRAADHCGFCTSDANCVCREAAAAAAATLTAADESSGDLADDESSTGRALPSRSQSLRPQPMEPKVYLTEPGNCDACRADPAKANFCRSLAAMRTPSILQPGRSPSFSNIGGPINNYISCSEAFDKLRADPTYATASEDQRKGMMQQLNRRQRVSEQGRTPLEVENASLLLSLSSGDSPPTS